MFSFFRKTNNKQVQVFNPTKGKVISLKAINDGVFSEKMLGDGFAVVPDSNEIYAPVAGKVMNTFPTKHAICIETKEGVEVLIHIGLDTVDLNGTPFDLKVREGDLVNEDTLLVDVDWDLIKINGKENPVIIVFTSQSIIEDLQIATGSDVATQRIIGTVKLK